MSEYTTTPAADNENDVFVNIFTLLQQSADAHRKLASRVDEMLDAVEHWLEQQQQEVEDVERQVAVAVTIYDNVESNHKCKLSNHKTFVARTGDVILKCGWLANRRKKPQKYSCRTRYIPSTIQSFSRVFERGRGNWLKTEDINIIGCILQLFLFGCSSRKTNNLRRLAVFLYLEWLQSYYLCTDIFLEDNDW